METNTLHDLTAAYALDALDDEDARAYEEHLAHCERCRDELASLIARREVLFEEARTT